MTRRVKPHNTAPYRTTTHYNASNCLTKGNAQHRTATATAGHILPNRLRYSLRFVPFRYSSLAR